MLKFFTAALFTLPLLVLAMTNMRPSLEVGIIQLFLTLLVVDVGHKFYTVGFRNLIKLQLNMDSLVAVSTSFALVFSLRNLLELRTSSLRDEVPARKVR
ncbi:MAG: hypothetical protein LBP35_01610 [Candidatus Ancillula trichonymphae]|nr:hypothetical protein [Candidatus Ancillula trichonymphae]